MIRILAVGKKHEEWVKNGIERYEKRLRRPFDITWQLLPHSLKDADAAREEESKRLLDRLDPSDMVILLDERGKGFDSPHISRMLLGPLEQSKPITIIIGGAYGVSEALQKRAQILWSFSPAVFPHQLVRLMLIEQIYRSQEIAAGRNYHHI